MNLSSDTVNKIIQLITRALALRSVIPNHPGSHFCIQEFLAHPVYDESIVKMMMFTIIYKENGSTEPEKCAMLTHQVFIDYQNLLMDEFQKFKSIKEFNETDFNPFELIHNPVSFEDDEEEDQAKAS